MSDHHLTDISFSSFDLPPEVAKGIQDAGFDFCTPIQAEALPLALSGKDITGQAQTGTGKTAAFLVAAFSHLMTHPAPETRQPTQPRAIMLAPTRELAIQIHKDAEVLGKYTGLKLGLVYGGTGYDSQRKTLEQGIDVLIGTPGRIIDYFKQGIFNLKAIQVMVLDEADRMFDLGFIKDIRYLLWAMPGPTERLNLLFSATLGQRVLELAFEHMNEATPVNVMPDTKTADKVSQVVYYTANDEKIPLLIGLLRGIDAKRSMVFVNTKHMAEKVSAWLEGNGFKAAVLSGDVPQTKRQRLLQEFSDGKLPVLVATDVAARGLHIPDVSHVFNFDLPQDAEDYVHRIGRTARAGASGDAVSFACEEYSFSLPDIETYLGHSVPSKPVTKDLLPEELAPPAYRPREERPDRSSRGRRGGKAGGRPEPRQSRDREPRGSEREARGGQRERSSQRRYEEQPDTPLVPGRSRKPEIPAVG
ncbi:MAG: ATP-dependent RNA helicase RhlB [Gammaproteobacteria bacterium]|nr:ATP-dependent RNA helicase RhlB [Gammaproteobacteria bacterium]